MKKKRKKRTASKKTAPARPAVQESSVPPAPEPEPYIDKPHFDANSPEHISGLKVRTVNLLMIVAAVLFVFLFLQSSSRSSVSYDRYQSVVDKYIESELEANRFKQACDYLIAQVRMFAITQDVKYMDQYFEEALHEKRREAAIGTLKAKLPDSYASLYLDEANRYSNSLMKRQYHAMRIIMDACGYVPGGDAVILSAETLTEREQAMTKEEKIQEAINITHDDSHQRYIERMDQCVKSCIETLTNERLQFQQETTDVLNELAFGQRLLAVLLLGIILLMILCFLTLILFPMGSFVNCIKHYQPLPMSGGRELRYLAEAYNVMYAENQMTSAYLRHEAEHDALTTLYNRGTFNKLREEYANLPFALLLIDVDLFKRINDTYGHDVGDRVLQKIARLLDQNFRDTDFPCRIGGDEFAVIMTDVSSTVPVSAVKETVRGKLRRIRDALKDTSDGLPRVTLSIGAAFNDGNHGNDKLYQNADEALYVVKTHGRDGCEFYGEHYIKE